MSQTQEIVLFLFEKSACLGVSVFILEIPFKNNLNLTIFMIYYELVFNTVASSVICITKNQKYAKTKNGLNMNIILP